MDTPSLRARSGGHNKDWNVTRQRDIDGVKIAPLSGFGSQEGEEGGEGGVKLPTVAVGQNICNTAPKYSWTCPKGTVSQKFHRTVLKGCLTKYSWTYKRVVSQNIHAPIKELSHKIFMDL